METMTQMGTCQAPHHHLPQDPHTVVGAVKEEGRKAASEVAAKVLATALLGATAAGAPTTRGIKGGGVQDADLQG
jgi:hypothetical protein